MLNWLKEFFGIGLNEVKEEVKKVEVKVENAASAVVQTATKELKEVETKIADAIKAESKPAKKTKAAAPKAKAKSTKKNAKK